MSTLCCDFCGKVTHKEDLIDGGFRSKAYNGQIISIHVCAACKEKALNGRYGDRYIFKKTKSIKEIYEGIRKPKED